MGSGGREHALAWKLAQSPLLGKLYAAPGNPGIAEHAEIVALDAADQELLDHHLGTGAAEAAIEHVRDRRLGGGARLGDHHALAGREAVRLDHHRQGEVVETRNRRIPVGEAAIGGGGNALAGAQILGEALRSFELRRGLVGPEHGEASGTQRIAEPVDQRRLRPDHDEADRVRAA